MSTLMQPPPPPPPPPVPDPDFAPLLSPELSEYSQQLEPWRPCETEMLSKAQR